ncbi:hypothetical protein C0J52_10100 [Blattella germanica]|nr:hypothetical protein C0J52_10100 [Blattella germanica]
MLQIGKLHELEGNSPVKVGTSAVTSKGEMERKRKLNHLSNRHRKEQMKQYNTEHFDLQREHQFLQIRLKRELAEPNRIQICLEYELAAARSQIRDFRRMLLEQQGRSFMMAERISLVRTHEPETRDVWTDTDNDTNSSGVQSLPTNEVVHSDNLEIGLHDTKQGRESKILPESTIGNTNDISKINSRIIATVLPFTDITTDTKRDQNDNFEGDTLKKQLKNAERLQESGIFEETEFYTQGRGDGPSPNCVAHVKELQYCRERLQILEDKVLVYESSGEIQTRLLSERLQREVRLIAQVNDLSTKVEQLSAQNKLLEEERCEFEEAENDARLKCQKLEVKLIDINEQKNDLQTQLQIERRNMSRLKTNLSESERKRQEARGQLSYVETILNKYENRNYELEEREVELRHRLEMLETTMPALMLFNMWRLVQDPKVSRAAVNTAVSNTLVKARSGIYRPMTAPELNTGRTSVRLSKQINFPSSAGDEQSKLKYLEEDRNRILTERQEAEEKWRLTEKKLNERLKELESQAVPVCSELEIYKEAEEGYKERIRKLENELYGKRGETSMFRTTSEEMASSDSDVNSVTSLGCESIECMKKIQELIQSEANMKNRITELELKERAYMETLQQADGLWSEMEHSYKTRIARAEDSEALLKDKVKKLEETESKNRQTYSNEDENYVLIEKIQSMEQNEKEFMEKIRALEMEKNKLVQETSQLREALVAAQTELQRTKELVEGPLKEELLKERKLSRTLQEEVKTAETELQEVTSAHDAEVSSLKTLLTKTSRELVDLECTNSELKEEVETLETKVVELKSSLERQKAREEEILIQTSQTILEKEKELEETKREMQFAKTPSAHEELKEVLPDTKLLSDKTGDVCLKECECPAAQGSLICL